MFLWARGIGGFPTEEKVMWWKQREILRCYASGFKDGMGAWVWAGGANTDESQSKVVASETETLWCDVIFGAIKSTYLAYGLEQRSNFSKYIKYFFKII